MRSLREIRKALLHMIAKFPGSFKITTVYIKQQCLNGHLFFKETE